MRLHAMVGSRQARLHENIRSYVDRQCNKMITKYETPGKVPTCAETLPGTKQALQARLRHLSSFAEKLVVSVTSNLLRCWLCS